MAVFATYGIPVLKIEEWPHRPEDIDWQGRMALGIAQARGQFFGDAIRANIGNPRYRPEEVTAGAVSAARPLGFAAAEAIGKRIRRDLLRSYN
jgi:hypothetical protein